MHWACEKQSSIFLVLWSESRSGKCAKFHTVAAGNNRDHLTRSLYYCLFVPHIFIFVCCSSCLFPFVMNRILIFNATPTEKLQTFPPFYNELHRSHVLFVKVVYSFYLWRVDLDLLVQLWLHQIKSFTLSLLHRNTYPAQHMSKNKKTALTTRSRYGRYPQQHSITVTGCTWHHLHILVTAPLWCDWKSRAASAQSFLLWHQAVIKIPRRANLISACSPHVDVVLQAHPVRVESHIHHNVFVRLDIDSSLQTNDSKWLDNSCDSTLTRSDQVTTLTQLENFLDDSDSKGLWLWLDSDSTKMTRTHHCP